MIPLSELNWGFLEVFFLIIIFLVGFFTTYFILPRLIRFLKQKKFVGYDIHKNSRPEVAESGGISIVIGFTIASFFLMIFFIDFFNEIVIFLLTVLLSAAIGFIDDRIKLRSRYKIILSVLSGAIIFFANFFKFIRIQSPILPFLDQTRLTIIYPILIPFIVAISANTVNMLEGYNGEGSGTCLIAVGFLFICSLIWNSTQGVIFTVPVIAVLIPFYLFNRYPAKIFPGDIGTLSMGAMIASIMLFGSLEVATICVLLIHIFNSFYILYSVRGFLESDKIREGKDDIILLEDDRIKASGQKDAALTLPRLILAKGPLTEPKLVKNFYAISIICGFFAIVATGFTLLTIGSLEIILFIVICLISVCPSVYILYKFPRIRGVIVLMIILLIAAVVFLSIIEFLILPLSLGQINLGFIKIPFDYIILLILIAIGLILWYYLTIRYFWWQINKMKSLNSTKEGIV
jgi:UDP-N-acetylglucosamine--dolichyl-phosphate N-acetylglucosaminephosphotransferase